MRARDNYFNWRPLPAFIYEGHDALCIPHRETFDVADDNVPVAVVAAKYVCTQCPLMTACRKHALESDEHWGVWGGLTRNDRERINAGEPTRKRHLTPRFRKDR